MELRLDGKSALVCGSTQGIGKAIAIELASLGAQVVLVARNEEKLKQVISELPKNDGQNHYYIVADFSKPLELKVQLENYLEDHPSPEILVNNTGGPSPGSLIDEDFAKFETTFQSHVQCSHLLAQALVPGMKTKLYGRIINVISTSVYIPITGLGVSNVTRGAMASWAKTLSIELAQFGITVNNVLPGLTETSRLESLIKTKAKEANISIEQMTKMMHDTIPVGRFGDAHEIANVSAFLASPAAAYVNGVSIPVDGGKTGCI